MLNNKGIATVFANSKKPVLVVSASSPYRIVSANNALCAWLGCAQEELLDKELVKSAAGLLQLLALSELQLLSLFEQVSTTKVAAINNGKSDIYSTEKYFASPAFSSYEIFPIINESDVVFLVIQVELPAKINASADTINEQSSVSKTTGKKSLELLIDSLSNVIFTLDVESPGIYKFSFVNRAFQHTTGMPVEKVIGKYVHEIIPEPSLTMVLEKYKEAIEGKQEVSWQEVSHYPAGQKTGEVLVFPVLNEQGNCIQLIGLVHDITSFKEAEAKQIRLTKDLYQQNSDLQQFTYIISHNLRAPLANALGLVRHLPDIDPGTELFKQYISHITTSIENLNKILADLNQILSIRDRQDHGSIEPVSLEETCNQAKHALEIELLQAKAQLNINIDPDFRVLANRAYIYSICYNLLSNAIKYRSNNRPLQINVTSESKGEDSPVIRFADNGSGLDIDKTGQELFKIYTRFHPHTDGRGIGLFLVKTHLEALGGHIEVESEPDKGTTFSVYFKELV